MRFAFPPYRSAWRVSRKDGWYEGGRELRVGRDTKLQYPVG